MISRLAFLAALTFLLAPAVPLAIAWVRLIPEEGTDERSIPFDGPSVLMLFAVTACYALQLPGVSLPSFEDWLSSSLPTDLLDGLRLAAKFLGAYLPTSTIAYAHSRRGPLRELLLWAGVLVLLAWLAKSYLLPCWAGSLPC